MNTKVSKIQKFTMSALFVALAYILNFIKIIRLPLGGSIKPFSMLALALPGYFFGLPYGFVASTVYGLLKLAFADSVVNIVSLLLDYFFAYFVFGITGFAYKKSYKTFIFVFFVAVVLRFIVTAVSGYVFWSEYTPENFNPILYAVLYNGAYIFGEWGLTTVILFIKQVRVMIESFNKKLV